MKIYRSKKGREKTRIFYCKKKKEEEEEKSGLGLRLHQSALGYLHTYMDNN